MAEDTFKLPRSSYDELIKVIKAYARAKGEVSNDDIAQMSGLGRTRVSANNAFLLGIEVVEGGRKKSPTPKGIELARALEHEIQEEVSRAWSKIAKENDFLNKMVQAVSVRKGMEVSQLENHIAYSAGEAKSKEVMTGARTIIDILRASKLVSENGDKIIPSMPYSKESSETSSISQPADTLDAIPQETRKISTPHIPSDNSTSVGISLNIEVHINANVDDIDSLGEKLNLLIRSLSKTYLNYSDSSVEIT